jgi:hypothetical protein
MRALLLLFVLVGMAKVGWGQRFERDTICGTDSFSYLANHKKQRHWIQTDLPMYSPKYYKKCLSKSKYGVRLELPAITTYQFNSSLDKLTSDRSSMALWSVSILRNNLFLRFSFAAKTINSLEDISFVNVGILSKESKVNIFASSLGLGYDIKIGNHFSVEPSVSFVRHGFYIHEQEKFESLLSSVNGIAPSLSFNKNFGNINHSLFQCYFRVTHGFVDFRNSHQSFGENYWQFVLGGSWAMFLDKKFLLPN